MPYFYMDWTWILLIPGLVLGIYAQSKVHSTYERFSKVLTHRAMTGAELARFILEKNNLTDIRIERVSGTLTDHYDPSEGIIRLSDDIYSGQNVAALGIAAHEVGHAIQHAKGYFPLHLRNTVVPFTRFGSFLYLPLLLLGIILSYPTFIELGILCFSIIVFFQIITLPVEFDASKRAISALQSYDILTTEELVGTKKVLGAAALTYVAAMVTSILTLLRLVILFGGRND